MSRTRAVLLFLFLIDIALIIAGLIRPGVFLGAILFLNVLAILVWLLIWRPSKKHAPQHRNETLRGVPHGRGQQEYGTYCVTINGEVVRSKGEKKVADFLFQKGIKYQYEPRVYSKPSFSPGHRRSRKGRIIGRPDFLLVEYNILVEYWGMVTVPDPVDRSNYQRNMVEKKMLYEENGYKLISLYAWDLDNLDFEFNKQLNALIGANRR